MLCRLLGNLVPLLMKSFVENAMKEEFKEYLFQLCQCIPVYIWQCILVLFVVGTALIFHVHGFLRGYRKVGILVLIEYLLLVLCSTVVFRKANDITLVEAFPFERYKELIEGGKHIEPDLFMNILVFVPVGLLAKLSFKGLKWWQALLLGFCLSFTIEVLQYVFKKGTTEIDDLIHNTFGCLVGFWLYSLIQVIYERFSKSCLAVL